MKTIVSFVFTILLLGISFKANSQCTVTINPQSTTTFCDNDSVVLIASATGGGSSQQLDQSQLNYNGGTSARNLPGYSEWQSFTAGVTGTLSQIDLGFFNYINGTGTLNIFSGTGTGGALLQTQTVNVFCASGSCTLPFAVNASIISGQVYTFQFIPGPAIPDPYGVQVEVPGTYSGGDFAIVDPSGTYLTGFDMVFQTYVSGPGGLTYLWSNGSVDSVIVANTSGTYTVTVNNGSGCTAVDSVQLTVYPAPALNLGDDTTICIGSTLLLDAGIGFSVYLWNDGSTNSTLMADTAGDYFVIVTNAIGCTNTDSIEILNSNCAPVISIASSDSAFCEKKCIDFFDLSTNNPISWQWYFPGADSVSSLLQNPTNICYNSYGSFDVTLIACNAFSCDTLILTNFINEYQTPSDSIYQSNDTLYSMPGYSYQWYEVSSGLITGATNQYYYPTTPGGYFCVASNAIGCMSTSNVITITGIKQSSISNWQLAIIPNPNDGAFMLYEGNTAVGNHSIVITDYAGRKVWEEKFSHLGGELKKQISLQNLAKGIYSIELKTPAISHYQKLILQ
ncbi:MAG: T9SS type A sorting domain-containing protein [Bacteroidia bacterium]